MEKARVSLEQCKAVGAVLQKLRIKAAVYQREFITFAADAETKLMAYLFSVGICQQTHSLIHKSRNLVGFNFLEKVFVDLGKARSELLDPPYIAGQSTRSLSKRLAALFSETGETKDSTLDRLEERAEQMIDMGKKLVEGYSGQICALLDKTRGYLNGPSGLYQLLSGFNAYSDPLRKKSSLFATFARSAQLFEIKDLENMVPIMDYHMQRVLLRLGCVEIVDAAFKGALLRQEKVDSDEEVRIASIEAVKELARSSGHPPTDIHDFLWPLGRSCCKEKPLCQSGVCDKHPCTFALFVDLPSHKRCVFEGTCKGSLDAEIRALWQPIVETHFY